MCCFLTHASKDGGGPVRIWTQNLIGFLCWQLWLFGRMCGCETQIENSSMHKYLHVMHCRVFQYSGNQSPLILICECLSLVLANKFASKGLFWVTKLQLQHWKHAALQCYNNPSKCTFQMWLSPTFIQYLYTYISSQQANSNAWKPFSISLFLLKAAPPPKLATY